MIRAKLILLVSTSALALSGCVSPDTFNDADGTRNNTNQGAALGAGLGALVGVISGDSASDRRRGAVMGAVIGAGAGALVGGALERQEAELREELGGNVEIRNTGDRLIVSLPQDILFDVNSAELQPGLRSELRIVANSLMNYPDSLVQVIGHTDNTGDPGYNIDLSRRRAQSVASVLAFEGVPSSRLSIDGRGDDEPVASNLTSEGRQLNRRVEIVILPTS